MMVNHGASAIEPNLLILGGTTEAATLCVDVHRAGLRAIVSLAGRVERPAPAPIPRRIGGFGGIDGLHAFVAENAITHIVDATHPFAAQMSRHAVAVSEALAVPLCALTRPAWSVVAGDQWQRAEDIGGAVRALDGPARRIMLAVGRMHLPDFASNPQHFYLLRLVDPPAQAPDFPNHEVIVARGPFGVTDDMDLMRRHRIDLVVSKNAGGSGAYAKIEAARRLGLPVLMIDRPALPERREFGTAQDVLAWVHDTTPRGV